jgi:hypothetical protein
MRGEIKALGSRLEIEKVNRSNDKTVIPGRPLGRARNP